jgi:ATP-dependent Lon protease
MQDQHDDASAEAHEAHIEGSIVDETAEDQQTPAVADEVLPDTIYLMPVPNRPFFPGQVQPVAINPEEWGETLKAVGRSGSGVVGLAFVPGVAPGDVEQRQFPELGCAVRLHKPQSMAENPAHFLAQGLKRFRIVRWLTDEAPWLVQVEYPRSQGDRESDEIKAYAMALIKADQGTAAAEPAVQRRAQALSRQLQPEPAEPARGLLRQR